MLVETPTRLAPGTFTARRGEPGGSPLRGGLRPVAAILVIAHPLRTGSVLPQQHGRTPGSPLHSRPGRRRGLRPAFYGGDRRGRAGPASLGEVARGSRAGWRRTDELATASGRLAACGARARRAEHGSRSWGRLVGAAIVLVLVVVLVLNVPPLQASGSGDRGRTPVVLRSGGARPGRIRCAVSRIPQPGAAPAGELGLTMLGDWGILPNSTRRGG